MKALLALTLVVVATACQTGTGGSSPDGPWLAHDVFFDLRDDSPAACQALVQDCRDALGSIPSVLALDAGVRDPVQVGEANALDYDVALHVKFADGEGLEEYLVHPDHLAFVERLLLNLDSVKVYDSLVQ